MSAMSINNGKIQDAYLKQECWTRVLNGDSPARWVGQEGFSHTASVVAAPDSTAG